MPPAPRIPRAQVIALSRPEPLDARWREWLAVAVALALLAGGLLGR
jgi:hypothetical protein